jgi:hypothetical protein
MAYDPVRKVDLLFGGAASGLMRNDTWTWNGTAWTQLTASSSPSKREGAGMDYDAFTGTTILFGGNDDTVNPAQPLGDTWSWNGSTWSQQQTASSPPGRIGMGLVYAVPEHVILVFGGLGVVGAPAGSTIAYADTWTY